MLSRKAKKAIIDFELAVEARAFKGTIPILCDDDEEQREADRARFTIEHNYVKARAKLERLLEDKELHNAHPN